MSAVRSSAPRAAQSYLRFALGDEAFAIALPLVREIVEYEDVTSIPGTPPWICGVTNLRGHAIPVVDIASKLGVPRREIGRRTSLLILDVEVEGVALEMGVMVDLVRDILDIDAEQIDAPPVFGGDIKVDYLVGLYRGDAGLLRLVDIVRMFSQEQLLEVSFQEARARRDMEARAQEQAAAAKAAAAKPKPKLPPPPAPKLSSADAKALATLSDEGMLLFDE